MSNLAWTITLFAIFGVVFTACRWWNKDTRGALLAAAVLTLIGLAVFVASRATPTGVM